jgi:hypothetical protein
MSSSSYQKSRISQEDGEAVDTSSAGMSVAIDEKKLLRKMDLWLLPWLSVLYLLSFLDRSSIGNARVSPYCADIAWPFLIGLVIWHGRRSTNF